LKLPVISYDAANDGQFVVPGENRGRIIVLNTIGPGHQKSPFMALVTQGIPSQTRLEEDQLRQLDAEPGPADLMQVEVDGDIAWIPNLEHLESLAAKVMV
ncbi:MAG: Chemotaxis signal transduction protein, partial [Marinobacter sp. T13-3]